MKVDGSWSDVDPNRNYTIALPSYLSEGNSNKWKSILDFFLKHVEKGEKTDYDALKEFIEKNNPITQEVEGRFRVEYPELETSSSIDPSSTVTSLPTSESTDHSSTTVPSLATKNIQNLFIFILGLSISNLLKFHS